MVVASSLLLCPVIPRNKSTKDVLVTESNLGPYAQIFIIEMVASNRGNNPGGTKSDLLCKPRLRRLVCWLRCAFASLILPQAGVTCLPAGKVLNRVALVQ